MAVVQVLIEGVGEWKAGEIVKDAPIGLVEMAKKGTRNAATRELICKLIEDDPVIDVDALKARAKELKIPGYQSMKPETMQAAVAAAEAEASQTPPVVTGDAEPNPQ